MRNTERDQVDERRLRPHLRDRTVNHTLTRSEREQAIRRLNAGLLVGAGPDTRRLPA